MTDPLFDDIVEQLVDASDGQALIADGFDPALIGLAEVWSAAGRSVVALYDLSICLTVLTDAGMEVEEAAEYIDYNVTGAYVGPSTPAFAIIRRPPVVVDRDS
ncbi:hypothetical protein [Actinomadura hibisca]|uniref:hypothetical protein n=1 Tax=Actinomadura hibisca TaxID=68565 RepID=UPI00082F2B3E|nr:hypothetical protein [Actinomadura hibisca]